MNEMRPVPDTPGRAFSHEAQPSVPARFSRHRYELPLLSVFLGLALLELVVVHLLVSMWSSTAAWVLTALSIAAVLQIAWLIRGMVWHPTLIGDGCIHVRHGGAGEITVPIASVERVDFVAYAPEEKGAGVFRATLLASPNIALRLGTPVTVRRRERSTLLLRMDDAEAFMARLAAEQRGRAEAT